MTRTGGWPESWAIAGAEKQRLAVRNAAAK